MTRPGIETGSSTLRLEPSYSLEHEKGRLQVGWQGIRAKMNKHKMMMMMMMMMTTTTTTMTMTTMTTTMMTAAAATDKILIQDVETYGPHRNVADHE
jgi:hypothetical protein